MGCGAGKKLLEGCWPSCPLLAASDMACWLIMLKALACHCRHHTHCQPPRANTANYFSLPSPSTSSALSVPIHLNFPLSAICLLNNTPPHFPTIPYPRCLLLYTHGHAMALPIHNCLLLVWSVSTAPASPLLSHFPSLLYSYRDPGLNCLEFSRWSEWNPQDALCLFGRWWSLVGGTST